MPTWLIILLKELLIALRHFTPWDHLGNYTEAAVSQWQSSSVIVMMWAALMMQCNSKMTLWALMRTYLTAHARITAHPQFW
jgi:hypothetical protein